MAEESVSGRGPVAIPTTLLEIQQFISHSLQYKRVHCMYSIIHSYIHYTCPASIIVILNVLP